MCLGCLGHPVAKPAVRSSPSKGECTSSSRITIAGTMSTAYVCQTKNVSAVACDFVCAACSRVDCTIWRMDVIRAAKRVAQQPSSLQPYSAATGRTAAAAWRLPASQPFDVGVHATAAVQQPTPQLGSGAENGSPAQQLMAESELVPQVQQVWHLIRVEPWHCPHVRRSCGQAATLRAHPAQ